MIRSNRRREPKHKTSALVSTERDWSGTQQVRGLFTAAVLITTGVFAGKAASQAAPSPASPQCSVDAESARVACAVRRLKDSLRALVRNSADLESVLLDAELKEEIGDLYASFARADSAARYFTSGLEALQSLAPKVPIRISGRSQADGRPIDVALTGMRITAKLTDLPPAIVKATRPAVLEFRGFCAARSQTFCEMAALWHLSHIALATGDTTQAQSYLRESLDAGAKWEGQPRIDTSQRSDERLAAFQRIAPTPSLMLSELGQLYAVGRSPAEARVILAGAREQARLKVDLLDSYLAFATVYAIQGDAARAEAYYDSASVTFGAADFEWSLAQQTVSLLSITRWSSDDLRIQMVERYASRFGEWVDLELKVGGPAGPIRALQAKERFRSRGLFVRLARGRHPEGGPSAARLANSVPDMEAGLAAIRNQGSGLIAYSLESDRLVIWAIDLTGAIHATRVAVSPDSIAGLVTLIRSRICADVVVISARGPRGVDCSTRGDVAEAIRALSAILLPPDVTAAIRGVKDLVIVPDGALGLLPFSILVSSSESQQHELGRQYALRYAPSVASLGAAEARPGLGIGAERLANLRRALVVANPDMPSIVTPAGDSLVLDSLPNAEHEGDQIARILRSDKLTGREATEAAVRAAITDAPVVHLATHAFADTRFGFGGDSYVALTPGSSGEREDSDDGFLRVSELLSTGTPFRLHADLVVLSACQSGIGEVRRGEGTLGLQRALLAVGARSVLVTLWSVDDKATEFLMVRFYTHWVVEGKTKATALLEAQQETRAKPEWQHPLFWAAFQIVGAN
jgi:CHAT domain-containing protein